jgi:hypothetical protein
MQRLLWELPSRRGEYSGMVIGSSFSVANYSGPVPHGAPKTESLKC